MNRKQILFTAEPSKQELAKTTPLTSLAQTNSESEEIQNKGIVRGISL